MTTPSHQQQQNISVQVYKPSIIYDTTTEDVTAYVPEGTYIGPITAQLERYTHTIEAIGGYWSASMTWKDGLENIEDWINDGLNRHIEVYDEAQNTIFEGFVNMVRAEVGGFNVVRGPLLNVANRVSVVYSYLDVTTDPPTTGATTQNIIVNDPISAAKYGILERVLMGGTRTSGEADQIRDTYLAEMSLPATDRRWTSSGVTPPSITIDLLGYVHRFQAYVYEDITMGTTQVDIKMPLVIDADPNELFSSVNASLAANAVLCTRYDAENRPAWTVLKGLIAYGGAADERYLFGVYANRRIIYAAIPTTIAYHQRLADIMQRVTTPSGEEVKPWNVLPGRWVLHPDYMIGMSAPTDPREDPRALFIESLTYTLPTTILLEGSHVKSIDQLLAKMGLGGI